jgi:predicted MFS family arabinose efflux permease
VERYKELAKTFETAEGKKLSDFEGDSFTKETIGPLIDAKLISEKNANMLLRDSDSISREGLTLFIGREVAASKASSAGGDSTSIFVFGWAIGGLFFGWVGDAIGRAKTMAMTILLYAIFTGLNGLAQTELQFNILRFLTALGVGGEFAAGAALVAESMPDRSRPAALGALQALSAVGNMAGALLAYFILPTLGWRWLFAVGAVPGLVAVIVFLKLKEPEKWREARQKWLSEKAAGISKKSASYVGLFEDPRWRKRAIVGLLLGVVGVGGLWGVGFFTPELNRLIAESKNLSEEKAEEFVSIAFFLQQFGAFLGISAYTVISLKMGRRPAFAIFFLLAFVIVSYTFLKADTIGEAYFLAPLIGFVTLGPFGGYAIYFPELFPTRLRSTGVGFCYNVGRFLAAPVSMFKGWIKDLFMLGSISLPWLVSAQGDATLAIRYGSFLMIFIYLIGLFVLLFAPETKGQPLPED